VSCPGRKPRLETLQASKGKYSPFVCFYGCDFKTGITISHSKETWPNRSKFISVPNLSTTPWRRNLNLTKHCTIKFGDTRVYPKVSGLTTWSENCKWYNCIAILWVSLVSFAAITLCVAYQRVFIVVSVYFVIDQVRKHLNTPSYSYTLFLTWWRWVVSLTPRPFCPTVKSPLYPQDKRLGGPQHGNCGEL
jgi:hypothetical protein